ncbi:hypothetical protein CHUAL_007529 [Chamberlinius hualienensis]
MTDFNYQLKVIIRLYLISALFCWTKAYLQREYKACTPSGGGRTRYLWGDALDGTNCLGPNGQRYPTEAIGNIVQSYKGSMRKGRSMQDPLLVRQKLLKSWGKANLRYDNQTERFGRAISSRRNCQNPTGRLCKTTYNTTAPLYGVSLTSGEPVTIVQKFPDLLQQVIFETCTSSECDVVHGRCTQTYVPYLFLVVPLGPVTLTGQDYVMVESGCVCKPKYSQET